MSTLAVNKRAGFDYKLSEKYQAGLVLKGHEVKSVRLGHVSLKESFVALKDGELFLINAHISPYKQAGNLSDYDPQRSRKLMLKRSEIKSLIGKIREKGLTLVPIRMYTKGRLLKLELAVGKGKKEYDKRDSIKRREDERKIRRMLRG